MRTASQSLDSMLDMLANRRYGQKWYKVWLQDRQVAVMGQLAKTEARHPSQAETILMQKKQLSAGKNSECPILIPVGARAVS